MNLPGPLVDPGWLEARLDRPGLTVVDVRWLPGGSTEEVRAAFESGHIPGAALADIDRDLAAPRGQGPGRHPLPSPEAFAATMSRLGVSEGDAVVAYDDVQGSIAARLWWMLSALGEWAALLDGGVQAWTGPLAVGPARERAPGTFTPRPWPPGRIVDADVVGLRQTRSVVLDARAAERYRGDVEPFDPRAGHIPGASSAPWSGNVGADGRFLLPAKLRRRYEGLGVRTAEDAIVYCGSGVTSCHDLLAMELAGLGRGRLYEGSWSDWSSDPDRSAATGEGGSPADVR